jgi:hypothetical protein
MFGKRADMRNVKIIIMLDLFLHDYRLGVEGSFLCVLGEDLAEHPSMIHRLLVSCSLHTS